MIAKKQPDLAAELAKLEGVCVQSELCSFDVLSRLQRRGIFGEEADKILNSLITNKFVDDVRFAYAFAYSKAQSAWGPAKIKAALAQKRINSLTVQKALAQVDSALFDDGLLRTVRAKAMSTGREKANTFEGCQKIAKYAIGRGFAAEKVIALIKDRKKWQSDD